MLSQQSQSSRRRLALINKPSRLVGTAKTSAPLRRTCHAIIVIVTLAVVAAGGISVKPTKHVSETHDVTRSIRLSPSARGGYRMESTEGGYLQVPSAPTPGASSVVTPPDRSAEGGYLPVQVPSPGPELSSTPNPGPAQVEPKTIPARPTVSDVVSTYEVVKGDTALDIAKRFGLDINTVIWNNDLGEGNKLGIGDELLILPFDGIMHSVAEGDTVESIAEKYKAKAEAILNYAPNHLVGDESLSTYTKIIVPGGRLDKEWAPVAPTRFSPRGSAPAGPPSKEAPAVAGGFIWTTRGPIYSYFRPGHDGIDISPPYGAPVYAAAAGRVVDVKYWTWSYGYYIIVDHGNGFTTLYGHNSENLVAVGQYVEQGQMIARVGATGKATGPHVHFEIRQNGRAVDPLRYLP